MNNHYERYKIIIMNNFVILLTVRDTNAKIYILQYLLLITDTRPVNQSQRSIKSDRSVQ